ncbi:DUF3084 domain-containing protein [Selenomonadales bacterium OttesenSCG-928-I06]|nr:DUF3084 domain-containing protein [Selenomonadales bacterium OttesenSCG-928-I06]
MYGIFLILVIGVMGGAIAYIGDRLGSKVGKKKLSIFGLRPKHTSIIVTIITGICIASVTIGMTAIVSRDVRTALFGMEEIKSQLASSRAAYEAQTKEFSSLNQKVLEAETKLQGITTELEEVVGQRDKAANELSVLQLDYDKAQTDLKTHMQNIKELEATKASLDVRISQLSLARDDLNTEIENLSTLTKELWQGIQNMKAGTVVLRDGEVLSMVVFREGSSQEANKEALSSMMYQTNLALLERFGIEDKSTRLLLITQDEFERASLSISQSNKDTIVRISTLGNTIYGEPVMGYITLYPNNLIYKKGTIIHQETFTDVANEQQAEALVILFLSKVNEVAIEAGMLPDPLSGTVGSMPGAKLFDAINKVQQITKNGDGKFEIIAETIQDITTVGPLQIDIKVKRL